MFVEIEVFHDGTGMIENYRVDVPAIEPDAVLAAYNKAFADSLRADDPESYPEGSIPPAVSDAWVRFDDGMAAFVWHDSEPDSYFGQVRLVGFVRRVDPPLIPEHSF